MIKLDLPSTPLPYTPNPDLDSGYPGRLLVLVSSTVDYGAITRRIWELAQATAVQVLLLSLCEDAAQEPSFRRGLFAMTWLLQDGGISVEAHVDIGTDWLDSVQSYYETGDTILCLAEQHTGLLRRPLSQVLESNLKATVYIVSSPVHQSSLPNSFFQVRAWLGFIGIIVGFGVLQANTVQYTEGWLQSMLLLLSTLSELWLICFWNSLLS